ncbi:MAG TPA: LacI family DNA-binding transcriptional regulator [Anaerohalosphaeraceae bacterium]|nr:LacI family DNA-binding transcriptional regulator [Anaerohalosphaeraceae bacterium]
MTAKIYNTGREKGRYGEKNIHCNMTLKRNQPKSLWNQNARITVESIARDLGVSASTVSFVMSGQAKKRRVSEKTQERVLDYAEKIGYIPNQLAQGLKYQRTNIISLLLGNLEYSWADITAKGVHSVFDPAGFQTVISVHYWNRQREQKLLKSILKQRYEGIICQPILEARSDYEIILRHAVPLVMIDILPEMLDVNYVAWDSKPAVIGLMEYLLQNRRKRIVFVGFPVMTLNTIARLEAYKEVMTGGGLPVNTRWLDYMGLKRNLFDNKDFSWFEWIMKQKDRPDAFLCLNDYTALVVIQIMKKLGIRIPDDVAVTGMGNLPITHEFASNLTTLVEPIEEIGRVSAEVITSLIEHPESGPIHKLIKSNELKIRGTT